MSTIELSYDSGTLRHVRLHGIASAAVLDCRESNDPFVAIECGAGDQKVTCYLAPRVASLLWAKLEQLFAPRPVEFPVDVDAREQVAELVKGE